ncbi:MAG TPA: DUF6152 family protein [Hyphomicrobiales bacterium]|nr:DUF6152 family protein [Hyphomicrobiales bacterium]
MKRSNNNVVVAPVLLAACVAAALSSSASAHHSAAAFDTQTETTITGTVTSYTFRNPHVYMELERRLENGEQVKTEIEAGAASVIGPLGFTRDAVQVGDVVNVVGNPGKRDPQGLLLGRELYKSDGTYLPLNISSRALDANVVGSAESVAGIWFSPRTSFFAFLGGARNWPVTDKGQAAIAASGEAPTAAKDCIPLGEPALMFYPVANKIDVFDDRVEMDVDWLDSKRVIWLDGREHPPADETSLHGHSIGHFEGTTLVVDSTNFSFNPIGFSTGLPSGTGKHLTERFELGADGLHMTYSGSMEDPEYLTAPVEWSGTVDYRPDMQLSNEMCDLETAQKFLDD